MAIGYSSNTNSSENAKNTEDYKYTTREGFKNLDSAISSMKRTVQANGIKEKSQEGLKA